MSGRIQVQEEFCYAKFNDRYCSYFVHYFVHFVPYFCPLFAYNTKFLHKCLDISKILSIIKQVLISGSLMDDPNRSYRMKGGRKSNDLEVVPGCIRFSTEVKPINHKTS